MQTEKAKGLPVLALDIGGTKILAAIVARKGKILEREYRLTLADEGPQAVIERIFSTIDNLLSKTCVNLSRLHSISIASAGVIDMKNGIVTFSPNLPGWNNIPLLDIIKKRYGIDTFILNDATAAVLGEHKYGAGRGLKHLIYITVSTGIGGGIITNGQLYVGAGGGAGEIGHTIIDIHGPKCTCGNYGCLETLASGRAVARETIARIKSGEKSLLAAMVERVEDITAADVTKAAREGDKLALEVIKQTGFYLGVGLLTLVNIFNPERIIVGGGLSKMGDLLLEPARQVVKNGPYPFMSEAVSIVTAELGDDVSVLGAEVFARQQKPG